jgi:hypothetical protein
MNPDNSTDDLWWPEDSAKPASPEPSPPRPKRGARTWILAGLGAVAIAALSVVVINVASSHTATAGGTATGVGAPGGGAPPGGIGRNGRGNAGTIASIDGSTITLTTQAGTTKVIASANTTVSVSVSGALGDIKTGDHVVVMGAASGATVAAERIADTGTSATAGFGGPGPGGRPGPGGPPAGGPRAGGGFVSGTVASIDATSLTITATDGTTTTVTTTSSTQVTTETAGTLSDLATGDQVTVTGPTGSDGTVTAMSIRKGGMV